MYCSQRRRRCSDSVASDSVAVVAVFFLFSCWISPRPSFPASHQSLNSITFTGSKEERKCPALGPSTLVQYWSGGSRRWIRSFLRFDEGVLGWEIHHDYCYYITVAAARGHRAVATVGSATVIIFDFWLCCSLERGCYFTWFVRRV